MPNISATDSKNFTMTNANTHDMQKHIVHPMSRICKKRVWHVLAARLTLHKYLNKFTFSGITSDMTTGMSGIRPTAAKNIIPEKLAIDTHEYGFTSMWIAFKYEYVPRQHKHNAEPIDEEINKTLRPKRSTENVAT